MLLNELFEAIDKRHASFCFGRMNPPTIGHAQLIDTVARTAHGGDYFIFSSQSQDSKKNPLDYQTKVKFLKALFPNQAGHIVQDTSLRTIMQIAEWLYNKGYRSVTFVAGSDRLDSFKKLLTDYNGKEGGNVYYKFDTINFVSSGDRDPDADGIAGVSASSAREAASQGNFEAFAQATGAGKLAKPLYDAVRKGMLLEGWKDVVGTAALVGGLGMGLAHYGNNDTTQIHGREFTQHELPADINKVKLVKDDSGREVYAWVDKQGMKPQYTYYWYAPKKDAFKNDKPKVDNLHKHTEIEPTDMWVNEHIVKHGSGYRLVSKKSGKNLGDFPTRAAAEKHEREVEYFKHMDETGGTGIVRGGNDPRYKNALTVDVKPNTLGKEMKAFGLVGRKNPGAPTRQTLISKNIGKGKHG